MIKETDCSIDDLETFDKSKIATAQKRCVKTSEGKKYLQIKTSGSDNNSIICEVCIDAAASVKGRKKGRRTERRDGG